MKFNHKILVPGFFAMSLLLAGCSGSSGMAKAVCTSDEEEGVTNSYILRAKSEDGEVDSIIQTLDVTKEAAQEEFGLTDEVMNAKDGNGAITIIKTMTEKLTGLDDIKVEKTSTGFRLSIELDPDDLGDDVSLKEAQSMLEDSGFSCE